MFRAVATHHPHPDHVDEMAAHMRRVADATAGAGGLLSFECVRDEQSGALLGVSRWDSRAAFEAAMPLIGANAHLRRDEWTVADDELRLLDEI